MTKLSVNINKFATLRNARGGNNPNLLQVALDAQKFGAEGITIHPRPDERHIRYQDAIDLKKLIHTEFNIEGYPDKKWMDLVLLLKPTQATLVPDAPDAITSNAGWDTLKNESFLKDIVSELQRAGIRTSIFTNTDKKILEGAAKIATNRVELYTEPYAKEFTKNPENAVKPYAEAAKVANSLGLGINAGHDLSLENLAFFYKNVPFLLEVSIGHALVCDALYVGLENTIQLYLRALK
ncbi:MAG: pyridoxine 5'-phosphate synthase [Thermonemataceae bacterium]|nr:pyridoxine 5'-phosphate synthase [Thermonemataceae bacterium]